MFTVGSFSSEVFVPKSFRDEVEQISDWAERERERERESKKENEREKEIEIEMGKLENDIF
jgi:hypothetical protein